MMKVWRYSLNHFTEGNQKVKVPRVHRVLRKVEFRSPHDKVDIWILVEPCPKEDFVELEFYIVSTGDQSREVAFFDTHIGTYFMNNKRDVYHVFQTPTS